MAFSITDIIHELPRHWMRRRNASAYGVPFARRAGFTVPSHVRGKSLAHVNDEGAVPDFLACFIEDCYGLAQADGSLLPHSTIVDVGANVGFFSVAARLRNPGASIHAYEPNPRIGSVIDQNAAEFGFVVHHEAVGAVREQVDMIDTGPSNFASTQSSAHGRVLCISAKEVVECCGGHIDFLKLDAEGAEWSLLNAEGFWPHVSRLRMEYHEVDGHTLTELVERLGAHGLQMTYTRPVAEHCGILWADNRSVKK